MRYLHAPAREARRLPAGAHARGARRLPVPPLDAFARLLEGSSDREESTTMVFVHMLSQLLQGRSTSASASCPSSPTKRAPSACSRCSGRSRSIRRSASSTIPKTTTSSCTTRKPATARFSKKASPKPARCRRGSRRRRPTARTACRCCRSTFSIRCSASSASAISSGPRPIRARAASCSARPPAARRLSGEGLQHQDGSSHLVAATVPSCRAYDPCFGYELAVIVRDGVRRMLEAQEDVFYYVTVMNENYAQAGHAGRRRGRHTARHVSRAQRARRRGARREERAARAAARLGNDPARSARCGRNARARLRRGADVWSVTSYTRAAARRHGRRALEHAASFGAAALELRASTCLRRPTGRSSRSATTCARFPSSSARGSRDVTSRSAPTGFGRSDTREALRRFFEVDRHAIVIAALKALADEERHRSAVVVTASTSVTASRARRRTPGMRNPTPTPSGSRSFVFFLAGRAVARLNARVRRALAFP